MNHLTNCLANMNIGGPVGEILLANTENWLQKLLVDDEGLFNGFADPEDETVFRTMWHGEYPGKLMTGIAQSYLLRNDPAIYQLGEAMVRKFAEVQCPDGYLGPWKESKQFEKDVWHPDKEFALDTAPECWGKWDTWGQYHCIIGLFRWYQLTENTAAKQIAVRALDNIYHHFIEGDISISRQNWAECNLAIGHAFALFYEETGEERYLQAAKRIVHRDWRTVYPDFYTRKRLCCDWLTAVQKGIPYFASGQPRWEGLYSLETLAVLERVTGEKVYADAMHSLWNSMVRTDRHNTGSFGTGEGATGALYGAGSETCNTVAWMAFSTDYLAFSRSSAVADELELSFYNATLGSLLSGERDFTYMNLSSGSREAAKITLKEQGFCGAPDMSCCQSNGNRGLTQPTQWAALCDGDDIYLNYFGESCLQLTLKDGTAFTLEQSTAYPKNGYIKLTVQTEKVVNRKLFVRIPGWSTDTLLQVNREKPTKPVCGQYAVIERSWQQGDTVALQLDMTPHYWLQYKENEPSLLSLYSGPVLLTARPEDLPTQGFTRQELLKLQPAQGEGLVHFTVPLKNGKSCQLTDFRTAGKAGESFCSWLPLAEADDFTKPDERTPWLTRFEKEVL